MKLVKADKEKIMGLAIMLNEASSQNDDASGTAVAMSIALG